MELGEIQISNFDDDIVDKMSEEEREQTIRKISEKIEKEAGQYLDKLKKEAKIEKFI